MATFTLFSFRDGRFEKAVVDMSLVSTFVCEQRPGAPLCDDRFLQLNDNQLDPLQDEIRF